MNLVLMNLRIDALEGVKLLTRWSMTEPVISSGPETA